jgi:hypothetical protein
MMVYYRVSALCPLSGILNKKKYILETGPISALRLGGGGRPALLGPKERANLKGPNRVGVFPPPLHPTTETDPV